MEPGNGNHQEEKKDESSTMEQESKKSVTTVSTSSHSVCRPNVNSSSSSSTKSNNKTKPSMIIRFIGFFLRTLVIDAPLALLFAALVATIVFHKVHDKYLYKQIALMRFQYAERDYFETTYYHRFCDARDVSATSVQELILPENATATFAAEHMLTHGVSLYPNLLSPQTTQEIREFIVEQNQIQEGFPVLMKEYRYGWGIDINMHPALKKMWKELASHELFADAIQEIVGPDPAIIEFTTITSTYGAVSQFDHHDVSTSGSPAKYAHTFAHSYSLFIPMQNTSHDMGATHVCPGTHLCSEGAEDASLDYGFSLSGDQDNWPAGWGALVNQQTVHKGMGHFKEGGLDRVVVIVIIAPRPRTPIGLETRMLGQGGSYSMQWSQWGHTFSDFVNAETRMYEPQKTLRSLGLLKGNGWNLISTASFRIANDEYGYNDPAKLEEFITSGGIYFIPKIWQGAIDGDDTGIIYNAWYSFLHGTMIRTEEGLKSLNILFLVSYLVALLLADWFSSTKSKRHGSIFVRNLNRLLLSHLIIAGLGFFIFHKIGESNWAKDIANGKAQRLPTLPELEGEGELIAPNVTFPDAMDILIAPDYSSDHLYSYGHVLEFAHPGNKFWKRLTSLYGENYSQLSSPVQVSFCQSLLDFVRQHVRILKQTDQREWVEVMDSLELDKKCHQDMLLAANPLLAALARQIDSLKTDAKYGRFRGTAMKDKVIPLYLDIWDEKLLPPRKLVLSPSKKASKTVLAPIYACIEPKEVFSDVVLKRNRSIPGPRKRKEPYPLAWIQVGDVLEARVGCEGNEWREATVTRIITNNGKFDVRYQDGTFDMALPRQCLQVATAYSIGDEVAVRHEEWYQGSISKIYTSDSGEIRYDISCDEFEIQGAPAEDLRRIDPDITFEEGELIEAQFEDEGWFRGTIDEVNDDGTYVLTYLDGDVGNDVPGFLIRKLVG